MIKSIPAGVLFAILRVANVASPANRAMPATGKNLMRFSLVVLVLLAACSQKETAPPAGNPAHGKKLVAQYGCTSCHVIPGIDGARGEVGPSLDHVGTREVLAGKLQNNPQNMSQYLQNPQMTDPQNTMPNLGVKPDDARDIGAYLDTLK